MQAIGLVPSSATSSPSPGILFVPNFNPSLIGRPLLFSHSLRKLFGSFRLSGRREKSWREKCVSRENSSSRVIAVSIPSKELGVGMYMERKKREKAICFIVEKIILPVDRSNLVDLVTRISRDLKYSFNEISTLLEEDRDNTVILSLFESGIRIASQFSVVNNLLRSKRESVGSRAYPRYRETITYIRNDTDETRMKIRAG